MLVFTILKNAFQTYRNSFLISFLGSVCLFSALFLLYLLIFPMLVKMPLNDFSQLALKQPEAVQQLITSADFQVKMMLFILLINCIVAPMEAGFYKLFEALDNKQQVSHKLLFSFYNSLYTKRILSFVLFFSAIKWAIAFLLTRLGLGGFDFSVSMILSLLFTLTIPIIIFENQSVTQAMKLSSGRMSSYMFTALIVLLLGLIATLSGIFLFGFGLVLTLPFFFAVNYNLYRSVIAK